MNEIKQKILQALPKYLNDTTKMMQYRSNREFTQASIFDALIEVVGQENVRSYGIHFRGDDFEVYASFSEQT